MPTTWTGRTKPTTSWNLTRKGGAYLMNVNGDYICDIHGNRIVVIVPGGTLPFTSWVGRPLI